MKVMFQSIKPSFSFFHSIRITIHVNLLIIAAVITRSLNILPNLSNDRVVVIVLDFCPARKDIFVKVTMPLFIT